MAEQHKNPAASRLTHTEYFKLANYMIARAVDDKIPMRINKFAEEVKQVHDLNVCYSSIRGIAEEHGIEMIRNKKAPKVPELPVIDEQVDAHFDDFVDAQALVRIEKKLDLIMADLGIGGIS